MQERWCCSNAEAHEHTGMLMSGASPGSTRWTSLGALVRTHRMPLFTVYLHTLDGKWWKCTILLLCDGDEDPRIIMTIPHRTREISASSSGSPESLKWLYSLCIMLCSTLSSAGKAAWDLYIYMRTYIYHIHTHRYIHAHVYICIYIHMYRYTYRCIFIHI